MPSVKFTDNLQRHIKLPPCEADGATVREVLDNVFRGNSIARGYVLDERGSLRKHMSIFISGNAVSDREKLSDPVPQDAEIYVIQALSGG